MRWFNGERVQKYWLKKGVLREYMNDPAGGKEGE